MAGTFSLSEPTIDPPPPQGQGKSGDLVWQLAVNVQPANGGWRSGGAGWWSTAGSYCMSVGLEVVRWVRSEVIGSIRPEVVRLVRLEVVRSIRQEVVGSVDWRSVDRLAQRL